MRLACPLKPKPFDIVFDIVDEVLFFCRWVGVIKTQITDPAKLLSNTKV